MDKTNYEKLMLRLGKAEKYMDEPYTKKMKGKELEEAIHEREKHVPLLIELMKEADECFKILKNN